MIKIAKVCLWVVSVFIVSCEVYAESPLRLEHKIDHGERLIGSVDLQIDTIQWVGGWSPDYVQLYGTDTAFGFTGDAIYNDFTLIYPDNRWRLMSSINVGIRKPLPNGQAPSLGFWFAPDRVGDIATTSYIYRWNSQYNSKELVGEDSFFTGTGIADDSKNPEIILDVKTQADPDGDKKIDMEHSDIIYFDVTPSSSNDEVKYIMVILDVQEPDCIGESVSFEENSVTENSFEYNDYFHYIVGYDPKKPHTRFCIRQHIFIVRADKTFRVEVKNLRATPNNTSVAYSFYVRGHYDSSDETLWADSHALFELTADYGSNPVIDSDGDGIADSIDPCPYDPEDNCNAPVDSDQDGVPDNIDPCPYDPEDNCNAPVDSDQDGVPDNIDPCPYDPEDNCNAPVNSDGVRVRLMWPDDLDVLYLLEGDLLDVSKIGGCYDLNNWMRWGDVGDSCNEENIIWATNLSDDGTGDVNLAGTVSGNKSVQFLSGDVIEVVSTENDGYTVKEKLANSDKEYFSFYIKWEDVDDLIRTTKGLEKGAYRYWIKATYEDKLYYFDWGSDVWVFVERSDFDLFFYDKNFDAISEDLFANLSLSSLYDTFQVPDIFSKDDIEKIKIEYGVIPWNNFENQPKRMSVDADFEDNYSFVLYENLLTYEVEEWVDIPFGAYKEYSASLFSQTDKLHLQPGYFLESDSLFYSPSATQPSICKIGNTLVIKANGSGDSVALSVDSHESTTILSDQDNNVAFVYFMPGLEPSFIVSNANDNPKYDGLYLKSWNPMFSFSSSDSVSDAIIGESPNSIVLPKGDACLIQIDTSGISTRDPHGRLYYDQYMSDWKVEVGSNYLELLPYTYTELTTGNSYDKIEIRSPISYDPVTGLLTFYSPTEETLSQDDLNSICFKMSSSAGIVEEVITLSQLFEKYNISGNTFNIKDHYPPGIDYFAQVLWHPTYDGADECSDADFDDVDWGLSIRLSTYPQYNSDTGVLTLHYASSTTDEQLGAVLESLCFEILRVTEDRKEEIIPYLSLLEWKGLIDSTVGNDTELLGYNGTTMWFDLSAFPDIFPAGDYIVRMSEGEGCASPIGEIGMSISNL